MTPSDTALGPIARAGVAVEDVMTENLVYVRPGARSATG